METSGLNHVSDLINGNREGLAEIHINIDV